MYTPKSSILGGSNSVTSSGGGHERSFTSASARAMASAAARRKSMGAFSSAKRSPFNTPGRSTPIGRSLQTSQIMESGGQYSVESFGSSLPALIMEALAFADKNAELSSVLSTSGWAWLVAGRRLLIWKYRAESHKIGNHQFRELTLPPSDLAHRAQLVTVFSHIEGQVPSCIAVSPEGFIRYWPNITHEGSYFEVSTELQGQECDSLVFLSASFGGLLATTTSTLLQVIPTNVSNTGVGSNNSNRIILKYLKAPSGILGGISKRVSSLVFGSMPTQAPEARLVGIACLESTIETEEKCVLVLSARCLQKWILYPKNSQPEKLAYECNIDKFIHEAFTDHVWGRDRVGGGSLQVWLIAIQPIASVNAVMILAAAVNSQISQQLVYALVSFDVGGLSPPAVISNFCMLKHSEYYQESAESVLLSHRFTLCRSTAYIYNENSVLCVPVSSVETEVDFGSDRVDFSSAGDSILGGGRSNNNPLFFSANHGIVSITPSLALNQSSMVLHESILEDSFDLSFAGIDTKSSDTCSRLQAAFMHFNRKNILQAQSLLEELFPSGEANELDSSAITLSLHLMDDTPASDPRWAEVNQAGGAQAGGGAATTSLIIINQINDKIVAHECYIKFLQQTALWQRLTTTTIKERNIHTRVLLAEHCEMLAITSTLRSIHPEHHSLVDAAIKFVVTDRGETPSGKLSYSDLFYRKISLIEDFFWGLLQAENEILSIDSRPRDASLTIHNVNTVLLSLYKSARESKISAGVPTRQISNENQIEYVPWVSSEGPRGSRGLIVQQHKTTVEIGLSRAEDGTTRGRLYNQLVDLTDEILGSFQPHLTSLVSNAPRHEIVLDEYQSLRYSLIQPLVKGGQYNQAISLAEKYCDFRTLIEICDKTENQTKLNYYMKQFGSQGFSDFVFRWYLETGKRGKLLSHADSSTNDLGDSAKTDLGRFLQDYSSLAWLHQINSQEFSEASKTLKHLAQEETDYLTKRKTLVSLSKLCSLASVPSVPEKEMDAAILLEEDLILYQEQIPQQVLDAHALDKETMRALSPRDIIMMYISGENSFTSEFDLKRALDLLTWIEDEEEENELKRLIWIRAILRDSWANIDTDNPIEMLSDTVFFKTVELAYMHAIDVKQILVPADILLNSDELGELNQNSSFRFLIKAGYEKIEQITSST